MTTRTRLQLAAELASQGRLAEARTRLLKEVRQAPDSATALQLLGIVTFELGKHAEAIDCLRRVVRLTPSSPGAHFNLGKAMLEAGHAGEAAAVLAGAVHRWPQVAEGRFSYGNALFALGQSEQAAAELRKVIELAPTNTGPYENLAFALFDLQDYEAVRATCERLLALAPDSAAGCLMLALSCQMLCDWEGYEARRANLAKALQQGRAADGTAHIALLLWDDARQHRRCAELVTQLYAARAKAPPPARLPARAKGRIRIAYVSTDFRRHPMGRHTAALIEGHDRERFEIVGISLADDDGSPERQRLLRAFDRFQDVQRSSTDAIVRTMREMDIDVAVDLMGHTSNARIGIFLQRVAPVQVSYLGFPGTTGIEAMDYLVVDPFIAAGGLGKEATERLAILPDCYQCNDRLEPVLADRPSRQSCGLPEDAFVFCSFNHRKKLTPDVFGQWMRIMRQVEGSVLWLLKPSGAAAATLRREAERHGVDPGRLVFADRVDAVQHIARNGVPDLHLDMFPYNAHTTASDALRAGCPILTRVGDSFPARVCGSLLTTIGVPDLITYSAEEYEAMAVRLARDPALLADLRRRIEHGRAHSPLFDSARFCRNIECAYEAMVERGRAGKPPAHLDVRALAAAQAAR